MFYINWCQTSEEKHRARYRDEWMKVRYDERNRINICTVRATYAWHFFKAAKPLSVKSAFCPRKGSILASHRANSFSRSISAPKQRNRVPASIILPPARPSLFLFISFSPVIFFFFSLLFFLAQRGSLVDAVLTRQPRSVRQFTPWPFCLPRSFFFHFFFFLFIFFDSASKTPARA